MVRLKCGFQAPRKHYVKLKVNGQSLEIDAPAYTPLLWVLREELKLTGTKYGCGIGLCGACTVHIDGQPVRSCIIQINQVQGDIITIEGLAANNEPSADVSVAIFKAWQDVDVPQCGYCQPGMIMAATALLEAKPKATSQELRKSITNICRCGTYTRVLEAIIQAQNTKTSITAAVSTAMESLE